MPIFKRILYYLGGFAIGVILLFYFVGGSGASCEYDYGPNARTLKNIRIKKKTYSLDALEILALNGLDTSAVSKLFYEGNVLFSESDTKRDSCKLYVIEDRIQEKNLRISVENCSHEVKIISAELKNSSD